jgi:hypothetical protein
MRWILWFLIALGWAVQTALLWHGNSKRAALFAAAATLLFAGVGIYFYQRDRKILQRGRALKIKPPAS